MGERIKSLREAFEMSQEELGSRIGVKRAAINKYEKGIVENIPLKTIEKLALIFNVSPQHLVGWNDVDSHLNYEVRVMKGVKYFFGQPSVDVIYLFSELNKTGQKKAIQYLEDLTKIYNKNS